MYETYMCTRFCDARPRTGDSLAGEPDGGAQVRGAIPLLANCGKSRPKVARSFDFRQSFDF